MYLTDRDAHQVLMYDTGGRPLGSLGTRDQAAMQAPFNHPADVCVAPSGELYVADGYGNSSVHRFSATGDYISSFGSPGSGPGQFRVPHSVRVSPGRTGLRCRQGEPPGAGILGGWRVPDGVDRLQMPDGSPYRCGAGGVRYRPDTAHKHVFAGWGVAGRGRTFEGAHQVYTDSEGSIYGVDTANQRVQKFVKL